MDFTLFLFAIPLNLIGYLLKHGTKLRNKLIPVIITATSCMVCFFVGKILGKGTVESVLEYGLQRGLFVAAMSGFGWDIVHGIKTVIVDITAQAEKLINLDKEENMDRLKKWHMALLSNVLTVAIVSLITFIVGYVNTKIGGNTISASIDMTVLAIVFASSGVLVLDIISKMVNKDKRLNTQYGICLFFAIVALISFIMAYIAATWFITIMSFSAFVVSVVIALFLVRYSYLPSLESKEEAIQRIMASKWKEYESMSDDEVLLDMKKTVKYYFKKDKWGADLNVDSPIFLDDKNNAIPVQDITSPNSPEHKAVIDKAVKDFVTIIKTREVK